MLEKEKLEMILERELSGQPDSAERGEWTLDHCRRTARLAVSLRGAAGEDPALDDLIFAAGLFHDVAHDSTDHPSHGPAGARRMKKLLAGVLPADMLEKAAAIVAFHDDRIPDDGRGAALHLVQDADLLDHFGAMRIWAEFGFAAKHGIRLGESLRRIESWQKNLGRYEKLLHYEASRAELRERFRQEADFLRYACPQESGEFAV